MFDEKTQMREIMILVEDLTPEIRLERIIEDFVEPKSTNEPNPMINELNDLIFKLRSHTENEDSEHSLGVEEGMQRAADMIENLIRRQNGE